MNTPEELHAFQCSEMLVFDHLPPLLRDKLATCAVPIRAAEIMQLLYAGHSPEFLASLIDSTVVANLGRMVRTPEKKRLTYSQ